MSKEAKKFKKKSSHLHIRLSDEDKFRLKLKATIKNQTISEFIRDIVK